MITIRTFEKPDFPLVQTIYKEGIDTGNATFQTQTTDWEKWNNSTLSTCRLVAEVNEEVVGWAALSHVSMACRNWIDTKKRAYSASIIMPDTQNSSSIFLTFAIIFVHVFEETLSNPLSSCLVKFFIVKSQCLAI